jgi:oligoribonuclease
MGTRNLLWVDLETTGLDPNTRHIIQLGMVVTDAKLNVIAEFEEVVHYTTRFGMPWDPEALDMHKKTGLLRAVERAPFNLEQVEILAKSFILKNAGPTPPYLAGSSVHFDQAFLKRHMPLIPALCHYRLLDVSVFKVIGDVWGTMPPPMYPDGTPGRSGGGVKHTALADIRDSIHAFKHYAATALDRSMVPEGVQL